MNKLNTEKKVAVVSALMNYNFVRVHQTLKTTPAVAAGVSFKPWTVADIVMLTEYQASVAA